MKKLFLLLFISANILCVFAQDSFNQKFLEANTLMEENTYNVALPIWLELSLEEPNNCNVNYKIGVCYIHSANEKKKSLDYLVKASENTTSNYDPFSSSEEKAPVETFFYLAKAYHLNYELDKAIETYNTFKTKISKKHYLFDEVDHHIQQCNYAKEAVANPANVIVNNLGAHINTEYPEYSPVLSLDESTIYFTSRRLRNDSSNYFIKDLNDGMHYEDIYVSYDIDGVWSEPELLNINTEEHEATVNISADGQTLFIYKDDNGNGNLYSSSLVNDEWTTPVLLGSDINLESHETHVAISPDNNILLFVSDRKGGLGGQDIYLCKRLPTGDWAKAQNLGDSINTPYDEDGIFFHPDGKTIYFSSEGHKSIGGFDIFSSEYNEATQTWSKPTNLGYPVNSTDDDVFFVTSADGKRGYYSSFQEKGFGEKDIYMISMTDAEEKAVTLLTVVMKVFGEERLPDDAEVVITDNATGDLVGRYKPRRRKKQQDGVFTIILDPGVDYHITYSALQYTKEEDLYVPPVSVFTEINRGIDLEDVVFGTPKENVVNETTDALTYVKGFIEYKKLLASGTKITLLDENDNVVESTKSDKNGQFNFKNLNPDEYYLIRLDDVDDDFIDNAKVYILNDKGEKVMLAVKKGQNRRLFKALPNEQVNKLPLLDENDTEIVETTPETTSDLPVLASYQEFFNYNIKEINTSDAKFIDLLNKAIEKSKSGKVIIEIEASSSKVPTRTYRTNENLSVKRADEAKNVVLKKLTEKGIDKANITFKKPKTLVQGPKYKGDYENTGIYEKYQYVTITLK